MVSTAAVDTILNQKDTGVICIYSAIGRSSRPSPRSCARSKRTTRWRYTIVVAAAASDPAPMLYIAPYAGLRDGRVLPRLRPHALCIYDDLSKHAQAYREISLLLRRPPGREAYPGDVFYLHSRLLERAAKLNEEPAADR